MDATKYEPHFYGPVQGVVIGEGNTVTLIFQGGQQCTVPFLAPLRPPYELVGRDKLLHDLKQRLFDGGSLALSALNGLPGVGKTALAVELAHDQEVLGHFYDGVLWAGLGRKGNALLQLGIWCIALGIPSVEITKLTSIEDRVKAIHTVIGMRRMLLVVDDAWEIETALAFKLGGPNCARIVTTRLPEVALRFAGEGTTVVHELSEADSLMLLARLVPGLVEDEPEEALALVQAVGGLPLALTLIGNYLRVQVHSRQPRRLHITLDRLHSAEARLQLAQSQAPLERHPSLPADMPLSLLSAIGISDEALDEASRHTLRTLSVFPSKPNSFSEAAALKVSAAPIETIDTLVDFDLLESSRPGRYTLHQTIADYAKMKLTDETAYERMAKFFVHYVEAHKTEYSMLDLENRNILAALQEAFDRGMQTTLVQGANAFYPFLETRGLYTLAETLLNQAQHAARFLDDVVGLATALLNMGRISQRRGDYMRAKEYLQEGLALARQIGDCDKISSLLQNLGTVAWVRGDYTGAEECFQEGLTLARQIGDRNKISALLQKLSTLAIDRGDYEQAEECFQEGLTLARQIRDPEIINLLLLTGGWLAGERGNYEQAEEYLQEGLALAREIKYYERISILLANLGWVAENHGDYMQAEEYLQQGLALAREIKQREKRVLNPLILSLENLGELEVRRGNYEQAEEYLQEGLALAREIKQRERISLLLAHLGELEVRRGNYEQAVEYLQEGLALAREIKHSERISFLLANLGWATENCGDYMRAEEYLQEGLALARQIKHCENICFLLLYLGRVAGKRRDYIRAEECFQEGLALAREIGYRWLISGILNEWGELHIEQQKIDLAFATFGEALEIAQEIKAQEFIAIALYGLAQVAATQGNTIEAHHQGRESLTIFEAIGHNKAAEVAQWLAELPVEDPLE